MIFAIISSVGVWFWFCKDCQNSQSILIRNLFRFYSNFASKGFKNGYNYFFFGLCVYETSVLVRFPESRKKCSLLKLFLQKNYQIIFFFFQYDQDRLDITNLPVCLKLLYKSVAKVIIMLSAAAVGESKVGQFQWVPWEDYCLGVKKKTSKLSLGLAN